jgi:Putative serine dehydratase domain
MGIAGVPTSLVIGNRGLTVLSPSEEHLPFAIVEGDPAPRVGDLLYLLPRHVCPTVNNFDRALIIRGGRIDVEKSVSARGHESPTFRSQGSLVIRRKALSVNKYLIRFHLNCPRIIR